MFTTSLAEILAHNPPAKFYGMLAATGFESFTAEVVHAICGHDFALWHLRCTDAGLDNAYTLASVAYLCGGVAMPSAARRACANLAYACAESLDYGGRADRAESAYTMAETLYANCKGAPSDYRTYDAAIEASKMLNSLMEDYGQ